MMRQITEVPGRRWWTDPILPNLAVMFLTLMACTSELPRLSEETRTIWFIDLTEAEWAVLIAPDGRLHEVPVSALPIGAREGMAFVDLEAAPHEAPDCLRGGCHFDTRSVLERSERTATLRRKLMVDDESGAIVL